MAIEWWLVLATLAGPVVAVQTQKWVERTTEKRRTRLRIFQTLMANRATRLNDDFVRALNMIDLEFIPSKFGGKKDKEVINAWRSLFGEYGAINPNAPDEENRAWNRRIDDRLIALLLAMSRALGYAFAEEELRRGIYYPRGRVEIEQNQMAVLSGLRMALEGKLAIPMKITEFPNSPELLAAQIALTENSAKAYGEDGALRVRIQGEVSGVRAKPGR
jgi:hypothetical protein